MVTDVKLVKDKATGQSAGSAFIKYSDHAAAALALQTINGHCIYGKVGLGWLLGSQGGSPCACESQCQRTS